MEPGRGEQAEGARALGHAGALAARAPPGARGLRALPHAARDRRPARRHDHQGAVREDDAIALHLREWEEIMQPL